MWSLVFEGDSWAAYKELGEKDKMLQVAFCKLLKEMLQSDPSAGMRRSVQLKQELSGLWSRRLNQNDRVIYKSDSNFIYIFAIGGRVIELGH